MKLSIALTAGLVASATAAPTIGAIFDKILNKLSLDQIAKIRGGRYIGTATDVWIMEQDAPYKKITTSNEYSVWTPENTMKWETLQPQQGAFNFTEADKLVSLARKTGKKVRGHTLVWHSQLAPWVEAGNFSPAELKKITKNHVQTVARHFRGKIFHWDVVNEVFNEDGTLRDSVFSRAFGEDFIEWAFRWAHEADPHAKLYITDYNFEGDTPKTKAVTALVRKLKKKGVPVHGIGAQGHFILGNLDGEGMKRTWKTWSDDLKVDVAIAELDIRIPMPATPEKLAAQAADYETVTKNCLAVKRCVGITFWQWTDKYSWVPGVFTGEGAPLPYDEDLKRKPAFDAVKKVLVAGK
ncbi:family 10 xylanase glycosyl hydrolase [Ascobolus immersus RN42]|uniref:Beta-xylanase n=1 Tax=Ascobolus immersus RN42 TaxID=1160509 RepID=A0A3N4I902_ASCIM|nr:family 10 xylanase glycosyl hydrolase [Ascobolus immersus RN42]